MNADYFARVAVAGFLFGAVVILALVSADFKNWPTTWLPCWMQNTKATNLVTAATVLGATGAIIDRITSLLMLPFDPTRYEPVRRFGKHYKERFNYAFCMIASEPFRAWRQRRRAQMFFNVNCSIAIFAGLVVSWIAFRTLGHVAMPIASGVFIVGLVRLSRHEYRMDEAAVAEWIRHNEPALVTQYGLSAPSSGDSSEHHRRDAANLFIPFDC